MTTQASEPYSTPWKNHRQRLVVDGVEVNEQHCVKCGAPWPCDVPQAWDDGYERGKAQVREHGHVAGLLAEVTALLERNYNATRERLLADGFADPEIVTDPHGRYILLDALVALTNARTALHQSWALTPPHE